MTLNRNNLKEVRQRKYLARDFDGLRGMLLEYARLYYPDKIQDFSESSLGGLFLDLAAYTGDNLSFYLDHQFRELDPLTSVEPKNIQNALRFAGVPIVGASPALVPITCFIEIPAENRNNELVPREDSIPVIKTDSIFSANNGTSFILIEDIDFNELKSDGTRVAEIKVGKKTSTGVPTTFIMAHTGLAVSGEETTDTFQIPQNFQAFRKITLNNPNVSTVINVNDGLGNTYYQVGALTHDVVFKNVLNTAGDNDLVKDSIKIIPAPYRFVLNTDLSSRRSTLTFGGGNAQTLEDDIIPDPSDFAIAFPFTKTFSRLAVNPNQLLKTNTLGVASAGTSYSITYRHGGGLDHNVEPDTVQTVDILKMIFPNNPPANIAAAVKNSIEVTNRIRASGGEDAPSVDELKEFIPAVKNSQERIVTREDLLARVYTLPSNFGRVFRAAIRSNPNNPLATQLFIVSRNADLKLIVSPDTLKTNLVKFLNPYRMIADAIDILDARIINLKFEFQILIDPSLNKSIILQKVLTRLQDYFNIKHFNIDQPIVISEVRNKIFSIPGVVAVNDLKFSTLNGIVNNREYSSSVYDLDANTTNNIIFPPGGGIFEVRFPEVDIVGIATI